MVVAPPPKTTSGRFFEDFRLGETIRQPQLIDQGRDMASPRGEALGSGVQADTRDVVGCHAAPDRLRRFQESDLESGTSAFARSDQSRDPASDDDDPGRRRI